MCIRDSSINYAQKVQLLLWKEVVKLWLNATILTFWMVVMIPWADNQYKGMLLDQLEDWQEVLDLAIKAGNTEIQEKVEKQIRKINEKLKF